MSESVDTVEGDIERRAHARVGRVIKGKYRLDRLLGVGGMGSVFAATHQNNRNRVAIKMLHSELSVNSEIRARFLREGYIANSVEHPGVVRVIDDDITEDGAVFLVLDLLEGETLANRLDSRGVLPPIEVTRVAIDLLEILAVAHDKGIVHRDIKPDNVFLTTKEAVKILDFGIARLRDATGSGSSTKSGHTVGTPAYMAPEQALGHVNKIGPAVDLFAVGATMFTLLTGRLTHDARSLPELLVHAATKPVRPIASVDPTIPPGLAAVIDRSLAFEIADRWASASEMREALVELLPTLQATVRLNPPISSQPRLAPQSDTSFARAPTDRPPAMSPMATTVAAELEPTLAAPTPVALSGFDADTVASKPKPMLLLVLGSAVAVCGLVAAIAITRSRGEHAAVPTGLTPPPSAMVAYSSPGASVPGATSEEKTITVITSPVTAASVAPVTPKAAPLAIKASPKPVVSSPPPVTSTKSKVDPLDRQ